MIMAARGKLGTRWATQKATEQAPKQDTTEASNQATKVSNDLASTPSGDQATARKGQTLRLTPDAWRQLKILAAEEDKKAHDLLIEAVNDLFTKYGKQPIA